MGIIQWGMIKQSKYFILLAIILLVTGLTVRAEVSDSRPLYLYYFETDDVLLQTGQTQAYQFTAFKDEKVTIVVYGLDELVRPEIVLKDSAGETVATGRSTAEQPYVRYIQFTTTQDETYTFDVSAVEAAEGGGLAQVMLVEGDPIDGDLTYLDTVNPLLPGRVFMVAGSDEIDKDVTATEVGIRTGAEVLPVERFREKPDIFVSRGSISELPPIEERFNPDTSHVWFNEDGDKFYFFTVHAIPEQTTSATAEVEYEALNLLTFFYFDYFFIVGAGSDPVLLSQETQPCSEVTLENRLDCERIADNQVAFSDDEAKPLPPPPDILPPDDTGFTGFSSCFQSSGYNPPNVPPYYYPYYTIYYYDYCYSYFGSTGAAGSAITGTDANDYLLAGGGNDRITAGGGDDTIIADDVYYYNCWAYNPYYYGFIFSCYQYVDYAGYGNDTIDAGDGNDTVYGGNGDDTIDGGNGNDTIYGDSYTEERYCTQNYYVYYYYYYAPQYCSGPYTYSWGYGNDIINGGAGTDTIYAAGGNDVVNGGDDADTIYGEWGDDTLNGDAGDDTLYGGYGNDTLNGGDDNDTLYGDDGNDIVNGGAGVDTLYGGFGNDRLAGGTGDDTVYGEDGDDRFLDQFGSGADSYNGGAGNDTLDYSVFATPPSFIFNINGTGTDTSGCVTATTCLAGANYDTFTSMETFIGGTADDFFDVSGTFGNTSTTAIGISGSSGSDTVNFDTTTSGYFSLTGVEAISCNLLVCVPISTSGSFTQYGTNLWVQWTPPAPPAPLAAFSTATSERWQVTGDVGDSFDGGAGNDDYVMGDSPAVTINDTGTEGIDTVTYAVTAAALTVQSTAENSFSVSDGSAIADLSGVENVTTGSANDIFLLHYNPDGSSNTYDAGENASNSDADSVVLDTTVNLTLTFSDNTAIVSQTNTTSVADTLVNFESVETGSGDDSFVMNTAPDGKTLNGGDGRNDITYTDTSDTVVTLDTSNSLTIASASGTDTVLNFDTVTTGNGNDVVNLDVNAASTSTDYTVNAGGGFNIFNFIFNSNEPLTDTVNMTVAADGTNNILDFSGVDTAVTIDTSSTSSQEIFTNFWLTLQGVFEAVFADEATGEPIVAAATIPDATDTTQAEPTAATVETCPTTVVDAASEAPAEAAPDATSTPESSACETPTEPEAETTDVVAEVTVEVTPEATVAATEIVATPEATTAVEPTVVATPTPEAAATAVPETPTTSEPPAASTPAPEATDPS